MSVSTQLINKRKYETVATNQTDQVMGATGSVGDVFERLIVTVSTSGANGTASIKDGSGSSISIVPANAAVGVHSVELNIASTSGAWKVSTGTAATAVGIGLFS